MPVEKWKYDGLLNQTFQNIDERLKRKKAVIRTEEIGIVKSIGGEVAVVEGLPDVKSEELVRFKNNVMGMVFNLDPGEIGVILLDESKQIEAGQQVWRTGRVLDIPVGDALLGRVIDALGRPLDNRGSIPVTQRYPIERNAPAILDRAPVREPLQTGIKAVDALVPIGRGQRELILGDRQTGKTAIVIDTIINQRDKDVICIYCAIGKQKADIAKVVADLRKYNAMPYSIVVAASGEVPPGQKFVAPYAATSIAEYFMEQERDVLIVYDDLTWHARSYRELSLLLRRPPGREAYPGDIFYIHARLLERATHLKEYLGGGSITAMPVVETQQQNLAAFIPTNLISITDGQIYLSPDLFQKDVLPAIDIGKSVSRVGGNAQLPAYRSVSGKLRLSYTQFQELETFARFSTRLDDETRHLINRGRRVREVLKQIQYRPMSVADQIIIMVSVTKGLFDELETEDISEMETAIRVAVRKELPDLHDRLNEGQKLSEDDLEQLMEKVKDTIHSVKTGE